MPSEVQVVLLDLGGMLLNLHDPLTTFGLDMHDDDLMETWLLSPSVRRFERGDIDASQFASEFVGVRFVLYTGGVPSPLRIVAGCSP